MVLLLKIWLLNTFLCNITNMGWGALYAYFCSGRIKLFYLIVIPPMRESCNLFNTHASPLMQKLTWTVNAARRFRYTLNIEKHEQQQRLKSDPAARLRAGTHVIRVCAPTPRVLPVFVMPPTNINFLQASGNIWQVGVWSSWYILQTFWLWIVPYNNLQLFLTSLLEDLSF